MTSMQEGMFWKTSGNIQKAQIGSFADSHLFIHGTNSTWKMECNCYRKTGKLPDILSPTRNLAFKQNESRLENSLHLFFYIIAFFCWNIAVHRYLINIHPLFPFLLQSFLFWSPHTRPATLDFIIISQKTLYCSHSRYVEIYMHKYATCTNVC